MSFGTRTKSSYELRFTTPILARPTSSFELLGFGSTRDNTYASHEESVQGLSAKIRHSASWGLHELGYASIWRQIGHLKEGASLSVRHAAGESTKCSISHSLLHDRRDDPIMPTIGYMVRAVQELAGGALGGSTQFLKCEFATSRHIAATNSRKTILNLSARTGMVWSTSDDGQTRLNDRFQLGGPTSVRGFYYNGLGPQDGKDSLGGDLYLAYSASVLTPLPGAPSHWPLRVQGFLNGGSLSPLDKRDVKGSVAEVLGNPSLSAGVGLVFKHPVARVEMSFCLPLVARLSDRTRKGLQFGLGVEFY